jgi:hypothetical protein
MKAFGAALLQQFPDAAYVEKRAISEGDLVLLHSNSVVAPGGPRLAVFDIFRYQDGKIAEHWDILQNVPAITANGQSPPVGLRPALTPAPRAQSGGHRWQVLQDQNPTKSGLYGFRGSHADRLKGHRLARG